jgi:radical SAM protein with 4Fe4S-binding SPASM domain
MKKSLFQKVKPAISALISREICFDFEQIPISIPRASYKKIFNWIRVELSLMMRMQPPLGWPTHLQIEPTTRCNMKCSHCPVSYKTEAPCGDLPFDIFKKLIDDTWEYALLIVLWGWGEPFMNPAIYDMIHYAGSKGVRLISSSNGHVFSEEEHAIKVVQSGLDTLIVSLTGTTQESYTRLRKRGQLETALNGIRKIVEAKRQQGSAKPFINLSFIVSEKNERQIPELETLARSLGVNALSLKKMNTCTTSPGPGSDLSTSEDPRFRRFDSVAEGRHRVKNNPCKALWHNPTLRWDGMIHPCTYDIDSEYPMGDMHRSQFQDIWTGESYRKLRKRFRKDRENIQICHDCTYAFEGGNYTDIIADTIFFD